VQWNTSAALKVWSRTETTRYRVFLEQELCESGTCTLYVDADAYQSTSSTTAGVGPGPFDPPSPPPAPPPPPPEPGGGNAGSGLPGAGSASSRDCDSGNGDLLRCLDQWAASGKKMSAGDIGTGNEETGSGLVSGKLARP
jgi:hypothetical protein